MKAALTSAVVLLALLAFLTPPNVTASAAPSAAMGVQPTELHPSAPAHIGVGVSNLITAILHDAVTEIGLPGQNLSFSVRTSFGWLLLKQATTDAQGKGYLDYDPVSPGNDTIQVAYAGNGVYAPCNATVSVVALAGPATPPPFLTTDRAIVLVILAVVGGVWATYAFVAIQVLGIREDRPEPERRDRRARSKSEVNKTMEKDEESPKRVSGRAIASRSVLIVAAMALVLAAVGTGLGLMSALAPKAATYTPTTVQFKLAVVPDIQGGGWDAFIPSNLVVHQGDTVKITIINADPMDHGFKLEAFGIDVRIDPAIENATSLEVTPTLTTIPAFVASQTGTFVFKCDVVCGDGHDYMAGTLQVLSA